jgi:putative two-component system response regulator
MPILVVDDQALQRTMVRDILQGHGYTNVVMCAGGGAAIEHCQTQPVDLMLLDVHMPEIDGYDVLRAVAPLVRGLEKLPVCMLTADGVVDRRREALALGARDFLTKPVDDLELVLRVGNMLELRELHKRMRSVNDDLAEDVRQRTADLEAARLEMLKRLARACEFRDDTTQRHAERIGLIASTIARSMGLDGERCELIALAAPLHDVGKVGISDSILLKPGRLTDAERRDMQRHAAIGARILSGGSSMVLRTAEVIALTHHERWDGTGYPHGFKTTVTPIEGRIVAVADVFDALTNARPYKEAWPLEKAIATIEAERGTHFDPDVVDAFLVSVPLLSGKDPVAA